MKFRLKKRNLKLVYNPEFDSWSVRYRVNKDITYAWVYDSKPTLDQIAQGVRELLEWLNSL